MLRLTGRYGDGWYPAIPMTPDQYATNLATIRKAAANAGRDPMAITPGFSMFYAVAASETEAEQLLNSPPLRFFALLTPHSFWAQLGHPHPLGEGFRGGIDFIPQRYEGPEILEAMAAVPTEVLAKTVVWGTPTQVTDQISELVNVGLRHVTLVSMSALVSPRLARFAEYEQSQASRGPCTACDPVASRPVFELLSGTHKQPASASSGPRRRPRRSIGQSGVPQ